MAPRATHVEGGIIIGEDGRDPLLKLMVTNEPATELFGPVWQPDSLGVAVQPAIQHRFYAPIALWRASDGQYRVYTVQTFQRFYNKRFPNWSTTLDFQR